MPRRALLIFAAIVVGVLGLIVRNLTHCLFTPFKVEPHLESGRESCTLLDVLPSSMLRKKLGAKRPLAYEESTTWWGLDDTTGAVILALGVLDTNARVPAVDVFRIHFDQPARVEGLDGRDLWQPPLAYLHKNGEEADSRFFHFRRKWQWWNPLPGTRNLFTDNGHDYSSPGPGLGYQEVLYSPAKDFFAFASGDAESNCTAYLQIYRRRDHRLLAKFRVESCSMTTSVILSNFTWVSDRDFLYVTGFRSSNCFICRFEK